MVQRPVRHLAADVFDHRAQAQLPGPGRQVPALQHRHQIHTVGGVAPLDQGSVGRAGLRVAHARAAEGVVGPLARGGEIELAIGALASLGDEGLQAGVAPQAIGHAAALGFGPAHRVDVAVHAVVKHQFARLGAHAHGDAERDRRRSGVRNEGQRGGHGRHCVSPGAVSFHATVTCLPCACHGCVAA